jgi:hypothetical protein
MEYAFYITDKTFDINGGTIQIFIYTTAENDFYFCLKKDSELINIRVFFMNKERFISRR